ncbi:MAG: hypothetical protein FWC64_08525, partial [Treponema sp.]|nr:hypothetical protein [Treponema sp.]
PTLKNLGKWLLDPIPANSGHCTADLMHSGALLGAPQNISPPALPHSARFSQPSRLRREGPPQCPRRGQWLGLTPLPPQCPAATASR